MLDINKAISKIRQLNDDWHSCGAKPPNEIAIKTTYKVISEFNKFNLHPYRIAPSTDEGIRISFGNCIDIECYNDGEIFALIDDVKQPIISEIKDIKELLKMQCKYCNIETNESLICNKCAEKIILEKAIEKALDEENEKRNAAALTFLFIILGVLLTFGIITIFFILPHSPYKWF